MNTVIITAIVCISALACMHIIFTSRSKVDAEAKIRKDDLSAEVRIRKDQE